MPAGRCGARTLSGSRSIPRCSPRTSASRPTPSCCTPASGSQSPGQQAWGAVAAILPPHRQARGDDGGTLRLPKQFNRHRRELRILRTRLGRLIRDIGRKVEGHADLEGGVCPPAGARLPDPIPAAAPAWLEVVFLPCPRDRVHRQGRASASYEFGVKVSIVTTNARAPGGQFALHAKALPGNRLLQPIGNIGLQMPLLGRTKCELLCQFCVS
jgi:hypothetical protein